jgi:TolB protein
LQLTYVAGPAPDFPRWSPDGKEIVFAMVTEGESDIFLIPAQGGQIKQLTRTPFNEHAPSFSCDERCR